MENSFDIKFKHERYNLSQSLYGGLTEDASLEAVKVVRTKIDNVIKEIEQQAKEQEGYKESQALEVCVKHAESIEELVLMVHAFASESRCPAHSLLQVMRFKGEDDNS